MMRHTLRSAVILVIVFLVGLPSVVFGCNLSDISLCGVTPGPGLNYTICIIACNGYGRTGASKGADNDTRSISFGWYDSQPGFDVVSFLPANITSARGFSNCTMPGADIGAQGAPYNSQGTVIYIDPGYYGVAPCVAQPFGCVGSTAACGNVAQQCITYTFVVNQVPDSVRVFGVEGGGNPVAGCYPSADMMIDFTILAVRWGAVEAFVKDHSVQVNWSTLSETNSDFFIVERAQADGEYVEIGSVAAAGNASSKLNYEMFDLAPMPGINRYRILQVDKNGNTDNSTAVEVNFGGPAGLAWGAVGPNPATDVVNLTFFHNQPEAMTLSMYDMEGKAVLHQRLQAVNGANAVSLALNTVDAGMYFVSLQGESGKLTRKVLKL
jgi:hypothetical protein